MCVDDGKGLSSSRDYTEPDHGMGGAGSMAPSCSTSHRRVSPPAALHRAKLCCVAFTHCYEGAVYFEGAKRTMHTLCRQTLAELWAAGCSHTATTTHPEMLARYQNSSALHPGGSPLDWKLPKTLETWDVCFLEGAVSIESH
ncbi:uncharacterized protein LOC124418109 [Gallus gallus]|uniref:uncharacterized protein LOC124418109 n=1 Tax=Gallus gallus TaxID=9031 RepID=UPI001F01A1FE|nr:uncharacterized protein LOC124418109 [Gallus gallus]